MTGSAAAAAAPDALRRRIPLAENWVFRRAGDTAWMPARVPGSNFTDLLRNGVIEPPFARDAELRLQWIEDEDWEYSCTFDVADEDLAADSVALVFEGLDTCCSVVLNGVPLLRAENMFCVHRAECRALLRPGGNELAILFRSPVALGAERRARESVLYPAENDKTADHASVYVRKAPYHFGWDWGPKYVTSGVWRPVWLDIVRTARIAELRHEIVRLSPERAELAFTVEIEGQAGGEAWLELTCDRPDVPPVRHFVTLAPGLRKHRIAAMVDDPRLWWPNGLGEAYLYGFTMRLVDREGAIDAAAQRIGLRTVEVVNQPDAHGECFYLKVNGRPVFMKGANYIPQDSFQEAVSPERHRQLFRDTADANMNMLRVWGGGVYESDLFYDLADEHGILIWQDFMFSCTLYPADAAFLRLVEEEAAQAVRRLRHHACLALWCGNNEISLGVAHWEWPEKFGYSAAQFAAMVAGNARLFDELLPDVVARLDPGRFYFPSSPIGHWNDPADDMRGDGHYWGVWHGELPFATYGERLSRFMSEYGFQSYPLLDSIQRFTAPEDRVLGSPVLSVHQKHARGDAIIGRFVREAFGEPAGFEQFCYLSQVLQADGLRVAFEAHRRNMPICMGSLYWQLNDCWPAVSWSGIDYYGQWKALHYQAARSFAPVLVCAEAHEGGFRIHGVSDRMEDIAAELVVELVDFDGIVLWREARAVRLGANEARALLLVSADDLPALDRGATLLTLRLVREGETLAANIVHPEVLHASALPEPGIEIELLGPDAVRISARRFARAVHVAAAALDASGGSLNFDDNFFDLLAGEARVVRARDGRRFDPTTLRVTSVRGTHAIAPAPAVLEEPVQRAASAERWVARARIRATLWGGTAFAVALALALPGCAAFARAPQSADAPLALSPPFALGVEQLFAWKAAGPLADARNVSRVPLASRMLDPGPGPDPAARLDPRVRVLFAPDGMNNFANYLVPQRRFNLYTFTHWAQIDVLSWFAGAAEHNVMIPARPWVDTAHRNGVKVIGTAFFAPRAWGGSAKTLKAFLREDGEGRFPAADRLVEIARHYGFDGWLINQETDVSPELGGCMARFMAYLTRIAPPGMEIHWYDAMLPDGRVQWQNAYDPRNAALLQDGATRVADAMFLNYQWTPAGLRAGAALAEARGRDRYALFIGADLWPARDNAQRAFGNKSWLRDLREQGDGPALGSVALFAPNFNFNAGGEFGDFRADPRDVKHFYDGETRLFAGDDRNMATGNSTEAMRTGAWEGLAALVPARSAIAKLPFETSFNTGHGLINARDGGVVGGPWHDMARQDPLPSWQFAHSPAARLEIGYDFRRAWQGGSSLRVLPAAALHAPAEVPLFLTNLSIGARTGLSVTAIAPSPGYALRLTMADGSESLHPLAATGAWRERRWCLGPLAGKAIRRISLMIERGYPKPLNLGKIAIQGRCSPAG